MGLRSGIRYRIGTAASANAKTSHRLPAHRGSQGPHTKHLHQNQGWCPGPWLGLMEPEETTMAAAEDGEEVRTRIVEISPDKAKRWLGRNHPSNRPVAYKRVEAFAGDMREGKWRVTHQGIAFDEKGMLIDGQHRLHAILSAGVSVRMMVVWSVGAFGDPIDCGRPRSVALLAGANNREVALVNALRMLELGARDTLPMTLASFHEVRGHHLIGIESVQTIPYAARKALAGHVAALVYALPLASEAVLDFGLRISSGERLIRGEPAFALYSWSAKARTLPPWDTAMATLNALRAHLGGTALAQITTTTAGYRAITAKRRALKIAHTPKAELVAPGVSVRRAVESGQSQRRFMTFDDDDLGDRTEPI